MLKVLRLFALLGFYACIVSFSLFSVVVKASETGLPLQVDYYLVSGSDDVVSGSVTGSISEGSYSGISQVKSISADVDYVFIEVSGFTPGNTYNFEMMMRLLYEQDNFHPFDVTGAYILKTDNTHLDLMNSIQSYTYNGTDYDLLSCNVVWTSDMSKMVIFVQPASNSVNTTNALELTVRGQYTIQQYSTSDPPSNNAGIIGKLAQIWESITNLPTTIGNMFWNDDPDDPGFFQKLVAALELIFWNPDPDGTPGILQRMVQKVIDGFVGLFVPDPDVISEITADFDNSLTHLGWINDIWLLVRQRWTLLESMEEDGNITFPGIYFPYKYKDPDHPGEYLVTTYVLAQPQNINIKDNELYSLVAPFVKFATSAIAILAFINFAMSQVEGYLEGKWGAFTGAGSPYK